MCLFSEKTINTRHVCCSFKLDTFLIWTWQVYIGVYNDQRKLKTTPSQEEVKEKGEAEEKMQFLP